MNKFVNRYFKLDESAIDREARTLRLSFASQAPYERSFGYEILAINSQSVNTERLLHSAPLLFNHDTDNLIGVVESVQIDDNTNIANAVVRFSSHPDADKYFTMAQEGILVNVSFKYELNEVQRVADIDGKAAYLVTRLTPSEISMVSEPADYFVGLGRTNEYTKEDIESLIVEKQEAVQTEERQFEQAAQENVETVTENIVTKQEEQSQTVEENKEEQVVEVKEETQQELGTATTENETSGVASRDTETQTISNPAIIVKEKQMSKATLQSVISSLVFKDGKSDEVLARGHEFVETNKINVTGNAICLNDFAVRATGDFVASTPSKGGYLVPEIHRGDLLIENVMNATILDKLGVTRMSLSSPISIPVFNGLGYAEWAAENGTANQLTGSFGQKKAAPHRLTAYLTVSKTALKQSDPSINAVLMKALMSQYANKLQQTVFAGSGVDPEPMGILNAGCSTIPVIATAVPGRADILKMKKELAQANVVPNAFAVSAGMECDLEGVELSTGTARWLLEGGKMHGYTVAASNDVPDNKLILGDWSQVAVIDFGALDIVVDEVTSAKNNLVNIIVSLDADVLVLRPDHFCIATVTV